MVVAGVVDQDGRIRELEGKVRDQSHSISGTGAQFDPEAAGNLKWRFKETVTVRPTDEDRAPAAAPASGNAAVKAAAKAAAKTPSNTAQKSTPASTPGGKK